MISVFAGTFITFACKVFQGDARPRPLLLSLPFGAIYRLLARGVKGGALAVPDPAGLAAGTGVAETGSGVAVSGTGLADVGSGVTVSETGADSTTGVEVPPGGEEALSRLALPGAVADLPLPTAASLSVASSSCARS
jgi:hypothetical protein